MSDSIEEKVEAMPVVSKVLSQDSLNTLNTQE